MSGLSQVSEPKMMSGSCFDVARLWRVFRKESLFWIRPAKFITSFLSIFGLGGGFGGESVDCWVVLSFTLGAGLVGWLV